jgi:beta-glucosidase
LKNENGILPLSKNQKVLIAGPTSNNLVYLNGAWTHTWQGVDTAYNTSGCLTVREAFEKKLGKENCLFSQGAELYSDAGFEKTRFVNLIDYKSKLKQADVVVLCLGELPATEKPGDILSLNLDIEQRELAKLAYEQNKKVIIVLLEGRPRIIHDIVPQADGIIQAYLPGNYGAEALVQLMFGDVNFSGKLPYTYPKFDGVIEFYDHPKSVDRSKSGDFSAYNPEWDFGYGLSYSNIRYSDLTVSQEIFSDKDSIAVSVRVKNESAISCKEVIQLYVSDDYASMIPSGKSLKRFYKMEIPAFTEVKKTFYLNKTDFQFFGSNGAFIMEEGVFTISIADLSRKVSCKKK